jgi:hypothetical protein
MNKNESLIRRASNADLFDELGLIWSKPVSQILFGAHAPMVLNWQSMGIVRSWRGTKAGGPLATSDYMRSPAATIIYQGEAWEDKPTSLIKDSIFTDFTMKDLAQFLIRLSSYPKDDRNGD